MFEKKSKIVVIILAVLMSCVLYFIGYLNKNVFMYLSYAFALYGFVSVFDDILTWLTNGNRKSGNEKHVRTNNYYMEGNYERRT